MYLSYSECYAIINSKPENKDLGSWFVTQVNHILQIQEDLAELKKEETILKSQFKVQLAKIKRRRREIRERCRHIGADPYTGESMAKYGRCFICGDEMVEL